MPRALPPRRRTRPAGPERLEPRSLLSTVAVSDGLVSWWTADNTAADLQGPNNATLYNGAAYAAGKVGQAFSFDGANDRANVADSDSLKLTGSFTIEGWVKVNAFPTGSPTDHGEILFRGDDRGGLDPYSLSVEPNGTLFFQVTNASNQGTSVNAPVATGVWTHVAAALDDATGQMRLYVNGAVAAQTVTTIRPFRDLDPASNPGVGVGNHGGYPATPHNFPFNGLIDELSVYNRALAPEEVAAVFNAGTAGKLRASSYVAADFPGAVEGAAGTATPVTFALRRVGSLAGSVVVNWSTADNTATAGSDYTAASGQVVFADGQATAAVQVTVNGDSSPESDETFWLNLSVVTPGYGAGAGLATVRNDDVAVSVSDARAAEGDARFGAVDPLVPPAGSGLDRSTGLAFGPDGNLYVGSLNSGEILRYDGATGAPLGVFVASGSGGLTTPAVQGLAFRPDGYLYVLSRDTGSVLRFSATTGAYVDTFVPSGSGGLVSAKGLTFGPDGNLYVSGGDNRILRYSGATGAFLSAFVAAGSGGLSNPRGLVFGPDGNLYVASSATHSVLRFSGTTGAYLSTFVPAGSGGLASPGELLFTGGKLLVASQGTNQVLRYDGATGAYLDAAVDSGPGAPDRPIGLRLDSSGRLLVGTFAGVNRYASPTPAVFTVTLNTPSAVPVAVSYATADGTAKAGTDYAAVSGTLTFAPGETSKAVSVPLVNDATAEPSESFTLVLSNPTGAEITRGTGVGTVDDDDAAKFFTVNDGSGSGTDLNYRYGRFGAGSGSAALNSGDTAPRGIAGNAAGTTFWVVDSNKKVYVYNTAGALLGSWSAGSLAANATVEGVASDGTDVWIVDARQDRVYRYAGAATRLSGSQNAASSFALASTNTGPKDIVTDGASLWVVNDGTTDSVFKYTAAGALLGSWTLNGGGGSPTGITLDPNNVGALWVVDSLSRRVSQYDNAAGLTTGSLWPSTSFALAAGNTNPQGIADPPFVSGAASVAPARPFTIRLRAVAREPETPVAVAPATSAHAGASTHPTRHALPTARLATSFGARFRPAQHANDVARPR